MGGRMLSGNDGGWWRGMAAAGWGCARGSRFAARGRAFGAAVRPIAVQGPLPQKAQFTGQPSPCGSGLAPRWAAQRPQDVSVIMPLQDECLDPGSLWTSPTTTSPTQIAVAPPSTVRQCPVVNAAPSQHRYSTALAISATVPMRPTGCMAAANSALRGSAS